VSRSLGIDVGGTYTDLVALDESGAVETRKVLSTPDDQSTGVGQALAALGVPGASVGRLVHGTTVVTNLLLERAGARVVLCATEGATDLLELRRQDRASLFDLAVHHPPPLVGADRVVPVPERVAPEGVMRALTPEAAAAVAGVVAGRAPEIVAVCLLHAYAATEHERMLAEALARRLPGVDVVLSSEVLPEIREYERVATTTAEAYARPGVARYLGRLAGQLSSGGYPATRVMRSSGGTASTEEAARSAASLALSGPAGGVVGAAHVARAAQLPLALTIDIGGTSADVGLIVDGQPLVEHGGRVAGVPIALPRVLVETVSAGGGSIGWIDDGGALRAGPRSAGAAPGPAAFGRGGTLPTITDAHVVLGNIRAASLSGGIRLDVAASERALAPLARQLGEPTARVAEGMLAAADASMARALRRVSVERGIDPRDCALIAFGGGGPLHACALADRLEIRRIVVAPHAGVLSALGLAIAAERREAIASVMTTAAALAPGALAARAEELVARADRAGNAGGAAGGGRPLWWARCRYRGQGHELDVPFVPDDTGGQLAGRFRDMHAARYAFTLDEDVEVVSARVAVTGADHPLTLARAGRPTWRADRLEDDGGPCDAVVRGRAVVTLPDATMLVAGGWTARALPMGGWMMERDA
jgi:N-methylhydantoinase A